MAKMCVASATSVSLIAVGFPDGIATPSLFKPSTALTDRSSWGLVPRNVARNGRPRSAASLLKYAVAITLFAAPCSQTNTMDGDFEPDGICAANTKATTIDHMFITASNLKLLPAHGPGPPRLV